MRYLREFNENMDVEDELKDFCEGSLAYLLDDKLGIRIPLATPVSYNSKEIVYLIHIDTLDKDGVYWNDIKDYFIPFIERLSSKYKVIGWSNPLSDKALNITYRDSNIGIIRRTFSCHDIIKEKFVKYIDQDMSIFYLQIRVEI